MERIKEQMKMERNKFYQFDHQEKVPEKVPNVTFWFIRLAVCEMTGVHNKIQRKMLM